MKARSTLLISQIHNLQLVSCEFEANIEFKAEVKL